MYSPKIKADLIAMLYRIKQAQGGKPMTTIVDNLLRPAVLLLHESLVNYDLLHHQTNGEN
jgi:hypothetical protein